MPYNEVEELKNAIRQRLQGIQAELISQVTYGDTAKNAGVFSGMQTGMNKGKSSGPMQPNVRRPKQQTNVRKPQMHNSMAGNMSVKDMVAEPMRAPDMVSGSMQSGARFNKYDCGHSYPKMNLREQINSDIKENVADRTDKLRYAVVMSEVLGEPVSRKRRRRHSI